MDGMDPVSKPLVEREDVLVKRGQPSKPLVTPKRHRKATQCFRPIEYTIRFVPETSPDFWRRVDSIYGIFQAYQRHYHMGQWAECCLCFERKAHAGTLGHPASRTITIKQLIERESIYSPEDLRRFMLKTLPRNKDGAFLMPQVNMRHPVPGTLKDTASQHHEDMPAPRIPEITPDIGH